MRLLKIQGEERWLLRPWGLEPLRFTKLVSYFNYYFKFEINDYFIQINIFIKKILIMKTCPSGNFLVILVDYKIFKMKHTAPASRNFYNYIQVLRSV